MLGLMLVVFGIGWTLAQDTSNDTKSKANTRTIAGCLSKGENSPSSNEYLLTANDGSTWEVRSDTVSLADHVGHKVSATGVVKNPTAHNMKEDAKDPARNSARWLDLPGFGRRALKNPPQIMQALLFGFRRTSLGSDRFSYT